MAGQLDPLLEILPPFMPLSFWCDDGALLLYVRSRSSFSSPSAAPPPRASYPHHEKHRKTEIIHWF